MLTVLSNTHVHCMGDMCSRFNVTADCTYCNQYALECTDGLGYSGFEVSIPQFSHQFAHVMEQVSHNVVNTTAVPSQCTAARV